MAAEKKEKKKLYYGFYIVGVCFLMIMFVVSFGSSSKGTFLPAITGSLGMKRSLFTLNDSLRFLTTAAVNFFFGTIVSKLGARKMVLFGFIFLIVAFFIYSFSGTYWQFYIGGALFGVGYAWTTTTIIGYIVEKWFTNQKGTIMGVILAASGVGGILSEQILTRIIYGMNGEIPVEASEPGWRLAYRVIAVIFVVVGAIAFLIIRNSPEDKNLKPLGQDSPEKKKRGMTWEGYDEKTIYRMPIFYITGICVFLTGFTLQAMGNVCKPYMYDLGINKEYVLYVFSLHFLFLCAAKILCGFLYDRFGIRISFGICSVAALLSLAALSFTTGDSKVTPWLYSVISSFAMPLETIMIPLLVSALFGGKTFSKIMGYYLSLNTLGYAVGVPIANLFYDVMGSYRVMLIILVSVMSLVFIVTQFTMARAEKMRNRFLSSGE